VPPRVPGPLAPAFRGFSPEVLNALHLSPTDLKHIEAAATAGGPRGGGSLWGPAPTGIEGQLGVRDCPWGRGLGGFEAQASNPRPPDILAAWVLKSQPTRYPGCPGHSMPMAPTFLA